jgi:hypothetical protein
MRLKWGLLENAMLLRDRRVVKRFAEKSTHGEAG